MTQDRFSDLKARLIEAGALEMRGAIGVTTILGELCDARDRGEISHADMDALIVSANRAAVDQVEGTGK